MSISPTQIVSVTLTVAATPQPAKNFGEVALFGTSARLPSEDRIRLYTDLDSVGVDFQTTDPEYLKAQVFFAQSPKPKRLKIGRRFPSGAGGHLNSGAVGSASDLSAIRAVTAGGMDITVGGTLCQLASLNFSSDTTFTAVASRLQTALAAAKSGTTCTWDGTKLIITGTGTTAVTVASAPTAGGSPTAIQTILKLTAATGAVVVAPVSAETVAQSLAACRNQDPAFYGVMVTESEAVYGDAGSLVVQAAAAWAQAADLFFTYTTQATDCLNPSGSTSAPSNALLFMQGSSYDKVAGIYSGQSAYADASIQGFFATVDYSLPNSIKSMFLKALPGVLPDDLTEGQAEAICGAWDGSTIGQNGNINTTFGSLIRGGKGMVATGRFIDEIIALDWLKDGLQTGVFNKIATTPTRIPATDLGTLMLISGMTPVWTQAASNGLLAPGIWQGDPLGEINTGDPLPKGYYVYGAPVSSQSAADRAARKAPPISAIAIGAGALQYCSIGVAFQR